MPLMQVAPAAPSATSVPDGSPVTMLGGRQGEGVVTELHGKFYTQTYRGKLFSASIFTAAAIPILATNATPSLFIWNPPSNPNNVVLVRYLVGFSAGTGVAGAIGYAFIQGVSSLVGTAAAVSAATTVPILTGYIGTGAAAYGGNVVAGSAATVTGTAPFALKQHRWSNLSQGAPITTTAAAYSLFEDFEGSVVLAPGTLWCPVAGTAIAETLMQSIIAYESPV